MRRAPMILVALLTFAVAHASPAQDLLDAAHDHLARDYGGLSTADRSALARAADDDLARACAPTPDTCPASTAYPILDRELIALGDEHSAFQDPDDYRDFIASATGGDRLQYGVKLAPLEGQSRLVLEVIPGSAAADAGLQRGDVLTTINGNGYTYDALREARSSAATITLGVRRLARNFTVTLRARESSTVDLPHLEWRGSVAVLRIPTFLSGGSVAQTVHDLVRDAQTRNATGMIVDLRGNGGGDLGECDGAVSAFVPTFTRVTRTPDGDTSITVSDGLRRSGRARDRLVDDAALWTGPLVIAVNEGSASCSEFFAFENQYAHRATLIGERTAGVGNSATRLFRLPGDAALQLTVQHYVKPDGTPYPSSLTPDVAVSEDYARLARGDDALLTAAVQALATAPVLDAHALAR
ncbi:S41 family peptidase [Deinococcus maricopensis]|uniref:Peptidase S41 n=1 Tax=Deinococcus maricopensis (strain DSM 21211 / LMG 22137 / NRRL B-23946 / LB-34) TaxID=709986 RepID=E8UBP0_DEIML|nr:S41 family peptidase [Deinococcus maricopensis]ADV68479.1 peptidase S41 [Deinococcus maricopensis DSM 21211]